MKGCKLFYKLAAGYVSMPGVPGGSAWLNDAQMRNYQSGQQSMNLQQGLHDLMPQWEAQDLHTAQRQRAALSAHGGQVDMGGGQGGTFKVHRAPPGMAEPAGYRTPLPPSEGFTPHMRKAVGDLPAEMATTNRWATVDPSKMNPEQKAYALASNDATERGYGQAVQHEKDTKDFYAKQKGNLWTGGQIAQGRGALSDLALNGSQKPWEFDKQKEQLLANRGAQPTATSTIGGVFKEIAPDWVQHPIDTFKRLTGWGQTPETAQAPAAPAAAPAPAATPAPAAKAPAAPAATTTTSVQMPGFSPPKAMGMPGAPGAPTTPSPYMDTTVLASLKPAGPTPEMLKVAAGLFRRGRS